MTRAAKTAEKQRGRPFKKGQSGNPSGRLQGSRNKVTLAVEAFLEGEAEALTRKAIDKALEGDTTALRLCLERLCPPRKDRPVTMTLPKFSGASGPAKAQAAGIRAVAAGKITPTEGQALTSMLEAQRRAIEAEDLERRITKLEQRTVGR